MHKTAAATLLAFSFILPVHAFEPLPPATMDDTRVFKVEVLQADPR